MFTCSLVSPYLQEKKNEERGKGSFGVSRAIDEEEKEDEEEEVEEEGLAFLRFVNSRDDKNMSPLHLASFKGHNEVSEDKPKEPPFHFFKIVASLFCSFSFIHHHQIFLSSSCSIFLNSDSL